MRIRDATPDDLPFLMEMWHTAAFWQPDVFSIPPEQAIKIPEIAMYIEGWGREGDRGVVAEIEGEVAGAAWYRTFTNEQPGYGFVNEATPELAVAVLQRYRRRGVATTLIQGLIAVARREGIAALSLSVNATNPSRRIYQRNGFVDVVGEDDASSEDDSYTMLLVV